MTYTIELPRRTSSRPVALPRGICGKAGLRVKNRSMILQVVQPALAGLIDGSVSTLAPLFAVAFATQSDWKTFLVGMASSIGAGVSMGFAEGLSDDGAVSGRGSPGLRGLVCGLATTLGGVGHTLPFLLHDFRVAVSASLAVVVIELLAIAYVKARFMDGSIGRSLVQNVVGGAIVLSIGILFGAS